MPDIRCLPIGIGYRYLVSGPLDPGTLDPLNPVIKMPLPEYQWPSVLLLEGGVTGKDIGQDIRQ